MISHTIAIARMELRLGTRNRWVLLATLMLFGFALILALLGSAPAGDIKTDRLSMTVASLATLSVYLVPLLALLVSFDGIAGEIERGTLPLLLATPIDRSSVLLGKFLGQLASVSIAIVLGFGIVSAIVAFQGNTGLTGLMDILRLILSSIALAAAFIAISLNANMLVRQSSTAAAVAVGVWLVTVVLYDLGLLAALVIHQDGIFASELFPWLLLINPADAFRLFNYASLNMSDVTAGVASGAHTLPHASSKALISLMSWVVIAIIIANYRFRKVQP